VLIGDIAPAALRDQRYTLPAFAGAAVAFVVFDPITHIRSGIVVGLDAAGLSLFAVSGASMSLLFGTNALTAEVGVSGAREQPRSQAGSQPVGADAGRVPSVSVTCRVVPPRRTVIVSLFPGE
jgi:hypothetical protein